MSVPANAQTDEQEPRATGQSEFLGFLALAGILYFAVVFRQLPEGATRWVITGVLVAIVLAISIAATKWDAIAKKLPSVRRRGLAAYDLMIFVLVVLLVVLAAVSLAAEDKVVLLKIFTVVYFSLLPALLYLQFSSQRTLAVWRDYVSNLYKLRADDPGCLPRPPTLSRFYKDWSDARERAWTEEVVKPLHADDTRAEVNRRLDWTNQYQLKFRDLFGDIPTFEQPLTVLSLRTTHKLQVVMATVLMTLGWTFVVYPESVLDRSFTPSEFQLANLPAVPRETFAFAFLGAYFYILQMLVRRYFQNDLKATAYINATMRIVIVILIVWVIDPLLADASQSARSALAFVIGVFPTVGWQVLQQFLIRKPLGYVVPSLEPEHKLGDLDGLNIWYESRLLEVGVEDMQNLATTDIVDLMLNTRIPIDRIVDWIDQAFLYLRVVDDPSRELLRNYGIRTATDLDDALGDETIEKSLERLLNYVREPAEKGKPVRIIHTDDGQPVDDGLPSRMLAVRATIARERNMQHIRAWKGYAVEATDAAAQAAKPKAARAAKPAHA